MLGYAQERLLPEAARQRLRRGGSQKTKRSLPRYWAMTGGNFCRRKASDPEPWPALQRDWREGHRALYTKDNTAHLNVGREDWRLTVPMVKRLAAGGTLIWRQPGNGCSPVLLGEMNFLPYGLCMLYVDAQQDYYLKPSLAGIISSEGQKMACTGQQNEATPPGPLGPNFSPQRQMRVTTATISVLSAITTVPQRGASGTADAYGETGVMRFYGQRDDRIYQADLGKETR